VDIYRVLGSEIDRFPGLERRIAEALSSGPILVEKERIETSGNQPRNYSFVYFVAGHLLKAGIEIVAIDGILACEFQRPAEADITILCEGTFIDIECKRPQGIAALKKRVREARGQISKRSGQLGLIAVDCSLLVRPRGKLLEVDSPQRGNALISDRLEQMARQLSSQFQPQILALILIARVPLMTRVGKSPIVSLNGEPYIYFTRDSCCSFVFVTNQQSSSPALLQPIRNRLSEYFSNIKDGVK
jgi:hypothetical protein